MKIRVDASNADQLLTFWENRQIFLVLDKTNTYSPMAIVRLTLLGDGNGVAELRSVESEFVPGFHSMTVFCCDPRDPL